MPQVLQVNKKALSERAEPQVGVLLTNLGTPAAPTKTALKTYLKEFLWDQRVIDLPRPLWWLILNGIILRSRPRRSAAAYEKIWTAAGSPLLVISKAQTALLEERLQRMGSQGVRVKLGMRYGEPSIKRGLDELKELGCERLIVLPLYPQYSGATVGSTMDALFGHLKTWRHVLNLQTVHTYYDLPEYIEALAAEVENYWQTHGRGDKLLISFHGLPERYVSLGDPYQKQCEKTATLLAAALKLKSDDWILAYQSRFGKEVWLRPYTDLVIGDFAKSGVKRLDVVAPGFAADCLETLEEINIQYRQLFIELGGEDFHYIPALNDNKLHIEMLAKLIKGHL